jgi:polyhydroxybutyrate depolymerase
MRLVLGVIVILALCAGLAGYFIYSPDPVSPPLSGNLTRQTMTLDGLQRTYVRYVPRQLPKDAPLLLVLHGSGEDAQRIRIGTGYGFERLADQYGFAVVYPNSASSDWNDCGKIGDFSANGHEVDDVAFLNAVVDQNVSALGADRRRVFVTGVSSGGFMSLRLALESPTRFRAVAAVSANLPAPENFKCKPVGQATSVMIMNGTEDPLVPFSGGESSLFGLFFKGGNLRSAHASADYFVERGHIAATPVTRRVAGADGVVVEQNDWHDSSRTEVELVTIHGGGHGLPQPYWRRPRLLGPSPMAPDGPAMIWTFLSRQQP